MVLAKFKKNWNVKALLAVGCDCEQEIYDVVDVINDSLKDFIKMSLGVKKDTFRLYKDDPFYNSFNKQFTKAIGTRGVKRAKIANAILKEIDEVCESICEVIHQSVSELVY